MSHVRCFAHALVTAVAVASWGAVVWVGLYHPSASSAYRYPGLVLLAIAGVCTILAASPVVHWSYLKQRTEAPDLKTALEAAWNHGCAYGKQEERRKAEITRGAALRVVDHV